MSQYLGAALAVHLFSHLSAPGVAWLRVGWAGAALWAWRRPRWRSWPAERVRAVMVFGAALAAMNLSFYLAIERLPLGTAVAIEFCGPITVAAFGARTRRGWFTLALAGAGVLLLAEVQWEASPLGVVFALGAAAGWATYIVLGARLAGRGSGIGVDGLAAATVAGALVIAPLGAPAVTAVPAWVVLACAGVALASNVVPYTLDQVVFRRIRPAQFALLSTLLPATAAATGIVVLGERPTAAELAGIGLVVLAVALRDRRR